MTILVDSGDSLLQNFKIPMSSPFFLQMKRMYFRFIINGCINTPLYAVERRSCTAYNQIILNVELSTHKLKTLCMKENILLYAAMLLCNTAAIRFQRYAKHWRFTESPWLALDDLHHLCRTILRKALYI